MSLGCVKICTGAATICPASYDLDLLTLEIVSESRVTWATSVPLLVFLGLSVRDLGPMRQTSDSKTSDSIVAAIPPPG